MGKPPPFQIHIHQCPDRVRSTVQTSGGELPLTPAELDQARCDGAVSNAGGRNDAASLITLCSACHRLLHEGRRAG